MVKIQTNKKKNLTLVNSGFPPTLLSLEFPSSFKDKRNIRERDLGPDAHVSSSIHPGLSCCMHSMPTRKSVRADHAWTLDPHCPDHRSFWASWFSLFVLTNQPPKEDCAVPFSRGSQECRVGLPQAPQLRHLTEPLWFAVSLLVQGWIPDFSEVGHSNISHPTPRAQLRRKR